MARVRWVVATLVEDAAVVHQALVAARSGAADGVEVVYLATADAGSVARAAVSEDAVLVVLASPPDRVAADVAAVQERLATLGAADVEVRASP